MTNPFFDSLKSQAKAHPKRILFPEVMDARIAQAVITLANEGLAKPVLVGTKEALGTTLRDNNLTLPPAVEFIDSTDAKILEAYTQEYFELRKHKGITIEEARFKFHNPVYFAMMMLREGAGDGLVSGAHSSATKPLTPAFQIIGTKEGVNKASSFFVMLKESDKRQVTSGKSWGHRVIGSLSEKIKNKQKDSNAPFAEGGQGDFASASKTNKTDSTPIYYIPNTNPLFFADCAINIDPSPEDLAEIAILTADSAKALGIEPRVALLSFSTYGSAKHPLADKVRVAREIVNAKRPDIVCAGEIQFDAALIPEIAQKKIPVGAGFKPAPVTFTEQGANVFIFPDLQSGNIAYKITQRLASFSAIGPILHGLNKPVNDLSRGCSVEDVVNASLLLTPMEGKE